MSRVLFSAALLLSVAALIASVAQPVRSCSQAPAVEFSTPRQRILAFGFGVRVHLRIPTRVRATVPCISTL